jgi:hypothetical protein
LAANPIEVAAREYCAKLLESKTARLLPPDLAEAFAIVAFSLGAAWALDEPRMRDIANAQIDSLRARDKGERLS